MKFLSKFIYLLFIVLCTADNLYASEDILSINPTHLGIIAAIFVTSIIVFNKILFTPLMDLDEKREKLTSGTSSEAKELKLKAEQTIKEYSEKINEARGQVQEERNLIRKEAQTSAAEMIERARTETGAVLADATSKIEKEAHELREKIKPEIELIAKDIASKLINKEI